MANKEPLSGCATTDKMIIKKLFYFIELRLLYRDMLS